MASHKVMQILFCWLLSIVPRMPDIHDVSGNKSFPLILY